MCTMAKQRQVRGLPRSNTFNSTSLYTNVSAQWAMEKAAGHFLFFAIAELMLPIAKGHGSQITTELTRKRVAISNIIEPIL